MRRPHAKFKTDDKVIDQYGWRYTVLDCYENVAIVKCKETDLVKHYNPASLDLAEDTNMAKKIKFVYDNSEEQEIRVKMVKCGTLAPISQNVVEDFVREGIEHLMENKNESCWYTQTGDTLVLVTVDEEDNYEATIATPRSRAYINVPSV